MKIRFLGLLSIVLMGNVVCSIRIQGHNPKYVQGEHVQRPVSQKQEELTPEELQAITQSELSGIYERGLAQHQAEQAQDQLAKEYIEDLYKQSKADIELEQQAKKNLAGIYARVGQDLEQANLAKEYVSNLSERALQEQQQAGARQQALKKWAELPYPEAAPATFKLSKKNLGKKPQEESTGGGWSRAQKVKVGIVGAVGLGAALYGLHKKYPGQSAVVRSKFGSWTRRRGRA